MKYKISNQVVKTGTRGDFVQCDLTDETGSVFQKINLFNGEATGKEEIEGTMVQNGKYWNFKANVVHTANIPAQRVNNQLRVQEKIAENVDHSQTRKEQGIANSGAIGNATSLVVAMLNAGLIIGGEESVQQAVLKYAKWYRTMYDNPSNYQDIPF